MHVHCPNGHELLIDGRAAVACPRCGAVVELAEKSLVRLEMAAKPVKRPARDDDEDDPPPRKRKAKLKDDDEDDRPRRKKPARDEEDDLDEPGEERKLTKKQRLLTMVRNGILLHTIKLAIYMAALVAAFTYLPLRLFAEAVGLALLINLLMGALIFLTMLIAPILGVIGSALCSFVPPKSEARGTILVSLVLDCLAPILGILYFIMWIGLALTGDDRLARLRDLVGNASVASTVIAWWMFMIFLRKVAFYMRETLLASEALNILTHLIVATVLGPALVVATFIVAVVVGGIFPLIMFLLLLGWLIYFILTFPIRMFRMLFVMRAKIWEKYLKPDDDDDFVPIGVGT